MAEKYVKGDTVTLYTIIGKSSIYTDMLLLKDAWVTEIIHHGENHNYVDGICTVCGLIELVAGQSKIDVDFAPLGGLYEQYADVTHDFENGVTVSTNNGGCHLREQLRIYDSSSKDGNAIITSDKTIAAFTVIAGNSAATLEIYGSNDGGATWVLIDGIMTTTSAYADYTVLIDSSLNYTMLKLDVVGAQIRIERFTLVVID